MFFFFFFIKRKEIVLSVFMARFEELGLPVYVLGVGSITPSLKGCVRSAIECFDYHPARLWLLLHLSNSSES